VLFRSQNQELLSYAESIAALPERLETDGFYQNGRWRIVRRNTAVYQGNRMVYDCLAISTK
jgi:hypothetical protein